MRFVWVLLCLLGSLACGEKALGEDSNSGGHETPATGSASLGKLAYQANGCNACHGDNGEGNPAPNLKALYNSKVTLTDGTQVTADDTYLKESLLDPQAKIVQGFENGRMPSYKTLSESDLQNLLAYLKTL